MAYIIVPTIADVTATAANSNAYIRDNQLALKDPPSQNYESNEGANYTLASATWTNVDTDFNFSITTTGGDVLISFIGNAVASGGIPTQGWMDVSVDGTRIINQSQAGLAYITNVAGGIIQFSRLVTGLAAGVHTFNLQWRSEDATITVTMYAGAGTASYDLHPQMWIREMT